MVAEKDGATSAARRLGLSNTNGSMGREVSQIVIAPAEFLPRDSSLTLQKKQWTPCRS